MFNFKKGKRKEDQIEEPVVQADDYLTPETKDTEEDVETTLSIPDEWNMSQEDRYVYTFHNNESPKLKKNQISLYGTDLVQENKSLVAYGLVRSTVDKAIQFGDTTILVLDSNNTPIARKSFDLSELGVLPSNSARPWKFVFEPDSILKELEESLSDWSIAFEVERKHLLDLEESWKNSITEEMILSLEEIVKNAPPLKPSEVNIMGIDSQLQETGELAATILIRNGSEKSIKLDQLPLGIKDASGKEIARGSFKLEDFIVKANTSKPWTFIFPAKMVNAKDADLSKWSAYVIQ